ncbi:MAG: glutathione peroxidase [Xanthomonadales bacterium]|nr:glutathione peroxidase [Xanthomonadales bacterium]
MAEPRLHDFQMRAIDGDELPLASLDGQVVLLVNVASKCGLTPQYVGLEALQRRYGERGFTVLGVPCNQFAGQEPGSEEEILEFCMTNYGVTFALTSKVAVNGDNQHPLYRWLTGPDSPVAGPIQWNFEKFLFARDGQLLQRFSPRANPDDPELIAAIESALAD